MSLSPTAHALVPIDGTSTAIPVATGFGRNGIHDVMSNLGGYIDVPRGQVTHLYMNGREYHFNPGPTTFAYKAEPAPAG